MTDCGVASGQNATDDSGEIRNKRPSLVISGRAIRLNQSTILAIDAQ
jgi:hypothetical protein